MASFSADNIAELENLQDFFLKAERVEENLKRTRDTIRHLRRVVKPGLEIQLENARLVKADHEELWLLYCDQLTPFDLVQQLRNKRETLQELVEDAELRLSNLEVEIGEYVKHEEFLRELLRHIREEARFYPYAAVYWRA